MTAPASAAEEDEIDRQAVKDLHDSLEEARATGIEINGDISEQALVDDYKSGTLEAQAKPDGCSTPKALDKTEAKKWNKVFLKSCNSHDKCYSKGSSKDRKTCDSDFLTSMRVTCGFRKDRTRCDVVAQTYYNMVRAFGKDHYKGSGKNN